MSPNRHIYFSDALSKKQWEKIGFHKRAGILTGLFSVYSSNSLGIGEFPDLNFLVDFCAKTSNSIIQLLPMNETGPLFCPYDSISSFAIEPAYLSLAAISGADKPAIKTALTKLKKDFPCGKKHVDYAIKDAKLEILWKIFEKSDLNDKNFKKFIEANDYWLTDFALYKTLKYLNAGKPWYEWEDKYKNRQAKALNEIKKTHKQAFLFYQWLQWQAFFQFKKAKSYAVSKKILLKGDLPVLVSRDSADVWANPGFFKLEFAAGAPPDMYCAKGQRWGMPTYNWAHISHDKFRYPKDKLKYAQNFYDILRIDHIVGLFRIWSIPVNEPGESEGMHGRFDPADERLWGHQGKDILSMMLDSTDMLLCGEDLGVIPHVCTQTMKDLGIPGNDVQRWVKDWNVRHDFLSPQEYRDMSVNMLSTHDTTNWAAWWDYEAGTIDEALFAKKCAERKIDYERVKYELFDFKHSHYGRLRWKKSVASINDLAWILQKPAHEIKDFIEIYENTYQEKEKLWHLMGLKGQISEKCDKHLIKEAMQFVLESHAVFCINLLMDWLFMAEAFKGDSCNYRINRPGTVSPDNWSLVMPLALETLLKHKVCQQINKMIKASERS
jgi:4-alpha-glucanotransferase